MNKLLPLNQIFEIQRILGLRRTYLKTKYLKNKTPKGLYDSVQLEIVRINVILSNLNYLISLY